MSSNFSQPMVIYESDMGASIAAPSTVTSAAVAPMANSRKTTIQPLQWAKPQINLILLGETGVGKTAMLNLLANVCAGVELKDFRPAHKTENERGGSQSGSQTNIPELYIISGANGNQIRILDTPGLADTRGIDINNEHKAAIASAIKEHFTTIDAIIILANGTLARLGAATQFTLTTISTMFPNSLAKNIAFIFTMVSDSMIFNFDKSSLPVQLREAKFWCTNNPFAQWSKYQQLLAQNPQTVEDDTLEEMNESAHHNYVKALKTLSQVFQFLDTCKEQPTKVIYEFYMRIIEMQAVKSNVEAHILQIENMCKELQKLQTNQPLQAQAIKIYEEYKQIINMPFNERKDTGSKYNTLCLAQNCYSNCHEGCDDVLDLILESQCTNLGDKCSAFSNSTGSVDLEYVCTICKHPAEDHQHHHSKWVEKTSSQVVVQDAETLSDDTDEANTEAGRLALVMNIVQKKIEDFEQEIFNLKAELSELHSSSHSLMLSGSFSGFISSSIENLKRREEKMKLEGADAESLQRMTDEIRELENQKAVLQNAEQLGKVLEIPKATDHNYNSLGISHQHQQISFDIVFAWVLKLLPRAAQDKMRKLFAAFRASEHTRNLESNSDSLYLL
ncbi:hypothetical protein F5878DRAFT_628361 [Lentinula raphanica]|uniref:AIG1-type G domain-containing protein n=1 Tax=Lentinula raphanica TaxID=153919 RepID=A0AA38P339_9AGAR|nr:hypothetical protein F5878DRAFT_628361 [Lentinula raphanica]